MGSALKPLNVLGLLEVCLLEEATVGQKCQTRIVGCGLPCKGNHTHTDYTEKRIQQNFPLHRNFEEYPYCVK